MANREMWRRRPAKKSGGCTINQADLDVAAAFSPIGLVPTTGDRQVRSLADELRDGEGEDEGTEKESGEMA